MRKGMNLIACCFVLVFSACAQVNLSEQLNASLCNDDFNRDDAGTLGSFWEVTGINNSANPLTAAVASQRASVTVSGAGGRFAYLSCSQRVEQKKTTISAKFIPKVTFTTNKILGLVARAQFKATLSDAYFCGLEYSGSGKLTLYKGINTQRTDLVVSGNTIAITGGTEYGLTFSLSGDRLICSLSGGASDEVSIVDSSFLTGYVGVLALSLGAGVNLDFTFDDFKTEVKP